jgi:quinol monooxygenase YgiN
VYIVEVYVRVKEKDINSFIEASKENARNSILEEGISKFDVLQEINNPQRFLLNEVYTDENAALEHKKTEHYKKWKSTVENMMEEPRQSVKYQYIFPEI